MLPVLPMASSLPNRSLFQSLLVLSLIGLFVTAPVAAHSELDSYIGDQMATADVPGLAAAVVREGQLVWTGSYGWRDTEAGLPVHSTTPFLLASVSKLVTATALMQVYDTGVFELDDAIDPHLPFTVRHPAFPSTPMTFRHLLMHLSSIDDNWSVLEPLIVEGDSPIALGDFLFDYLDVDGDLYDPAANFHGFRPGSAYAYSNVGSALIGYLVERLSGLSFDRYCEEHLFEPLAMAETGWFLSDFDMLSDIARPHEFEPSTHSFVPLDHYGFPDYPNGQLRSSASDMARFMLMHLGGGVLNGERVLEAATVELMQAVTLPALAPDQGLGFYWDVASGQDVVGHNGGEVGVYSDFFFDPASGVGVLVIANADATDPDAMWSIVERLFDEAPSLEGGLFRDGFESGSLAGWHASIGAP